MYLWWDAFVEVDGHLRAYGHYVLSNDGGSWKARSSPYTALWGTSHTRT